MYHIGSLLDFEQNLLRYNDPLLLRSIQRRAWEKFKSLSYLSQQNEHWGFSKIHNINPNEFSLTFSLITERVKGVVLVKSSLFSQFQTRQVFLNNNLVSQSDEFNEFSKKGVLCLTIKNAWRFKFILLKKYFLKQSNTFGSERFQALHQAFCNNGTLIYIPRDVKLKKPVVIYHHISGNKISIFPYTLLIAEDNSSVDVIDIYSSLEDNESAFIVTSFHSYAMPGSRINRIMVQNFNKKTFGLHIECNVVEKKSRMGVTLVNTGGNIIRSENQINMIGSNGISNIISLSIANDNQHFDQHSLQTHLKSHATSNLIFENMVFDEASTVFSGLIYVNKHAQQTDAYQLNRNLLLSKHAVSISLPSLKIKTDEVKCSHGSTSSQIDKNQLFYLQTRGISGSMAEELIVFGFFEQIIYNFNNKQFAKIFLLKVIQKIQKIHNGDS